MLKQIAVSISLSILFVSACCARPNEQFTSTLACRGKKYNIYYPLGNFNKVNTPNYTEGYFYAISYKDSSYLQIHCGGGIQHPLIAKKEYIVTDSLRESNYIKRFGYIANKTLAWREDYYPYRNVTVIYVNVPKVTKEAFEKSLNEFRSALREK